MAGRGGLEPPLRGPEPRVLPLDDLPTSVQFYAGALVSVKARNSSGTQWNLGTWSAGLQHRPLERAARLEARHAAGWDPDELSRARIPAATLGAPGNQEGA